MTTPSYRSIFISDVHLGFKDAKTDYLIQFLERNEFDTLYLVGDLIDFWQAHKGWRWRSSHSRLIQRIMGYAMDGKRVIYVPGNHDEVVRYFDGLDFSGIEIHDEIVHENADGRRFLVLHGDVFDAAVQCRFPRWFGDFAYDVLLFVNRWINSFRRRFGLGYWSLANFLKKHIKEAAKHIERFEEAAAHEAGRRDLDGVICGHIHKPEMREINGVLYINDGDWVESCTALVEQHDGRLEILQVLDQQTVLVGESRPSPATELPQGAPAMT